MSTFLTATTWPCTAPGRYEGTLDASWYQGRGVYGGVLAASILRAMRAEVPDTERLPRSLTVHFAAPAIAGPARLEVGVEREGTRVSHLFARVLQADKPVAIATSTFAASRREAVHYDRSTRPAVPPPSDVDFIPWNPFFPVFVKHFELAFAYGSIPYSGAEHPRLGGWMRLAEPTLLDAPLAAAYLDAWPPGVLAVVTEPRAAASVDLRIDFFTELPRPSARTGEHHLVTVESSFASDGYTEELRELWSEDGVRLAQCRQLIALLG
ncbi:thioesterase family protein [Myxococcota bacterium]|nr:thioesterase family protein [Myxococcota bacterium]